VRRHNAAIIAATMAAVVPLWLLMFVGA